MPDYTFPSGTVLVEGSGEFAVGATGVLRVDGEQVQVYDLNDSPIPSIFVGPRGVHQAFKADVPDGLLDFGSTLMPVVSVESHRAGLRAIELAEDAQRQAADNLQAALDARDDAAESASAAQQAAAVVVATPRFVLHGDDADFPRPDENVLPVIWVGAVLPNDADPARDQWIKPVPLTGG